jgi:hypothetical protein
MTTGANAADAGKGEMDHLSRYYPQAFPAYDQTVSAVVAAVE